MLKPITTSRMVRPETRAVDPSRGMTSGDEWFQCGGGTTAGWEHVQERMQEGD